MKKEIKEKNNKVDNKKSLKNNKKDKSIEIKKTNKSLKEEKKTKEKKKINPKKIIKIVILVILLGTFIYSFSKLAIFFHDIYVNKRDNFNLIKDVITDENKPIDFEKLTSINNDIVGWIKFNNNKLNNAVVQGEDNDFYLDHSIKKKKNKAGSVFMDYRNVSLDDQNVIFYGHPMLDGSMFASLVDVFKKDFFKKDENSLIKLIDKDNNVYTYQIFSFYITTAEEYYITPRFENTKDYEKFLKTIKKRSEKNLKIDLNTDDKILTLSTCYGTGNTTKRRVVHAKRITQES